MNWLITNDIVANVIGTFSRVKINIILIYCALKRLVFHLVFCPFKMSHHNHFILRKYY
jgi:hypothetical protein